MSGQPGNVALGLAERDRAEPPALSVPAHTSNILRRSGAKPVKRRVRFADLPEETGQTSMRLDPRDELRQFLAIARQEQRREEQRFSEKYNFDFANEKPLETGNARWEWEKVENVRSTPVQRESGAQRVPTQTTTSALTQASTVVLATSPWGHGSGERPSRTLQLRIMPSGRAEKSQQSAEPVPPGTSAMHALEERGVNRAECRKERDSATPSPRRPVPNQNAFVRASLTSGKCEALRENLKCSPIKGQPRGDVETPRKRQRLAADSPQAGRRSKSASPGASAGVSLNQSPISVYFPVLKRNHASQSDS